MKETRNIKRKLISWIVLAAVLLNLTSCNHTPKGYVPEGYVPEGYVPEGYVPEGYISIEDARALLSATTLPVGYLDGVNEDISEEDGERISQEVMEMEESFVAAEAPSVNVRDWSVYASKLAKEDMTFEEAAYYDRLDEACRKYIENAALDGVRNEKFNWYTTGPVVYNDGNGGLKLTKEQALAVAWWFKYNNPQYYFITSGRLSTSKELYLGIYEFAADGKERVKITNELFDKLDGWIESVNRESSTWQKELSANNLLCKNIVYTNGDYDQSLYSAVIQGNTVCAGYAAAFCAMMNASGIDTAVALSPTHAWNVVRYDDGNHYAVDVTWNDNKNDDNNPNNKYFNVGEMTLKMGDDGEHTYKEDCAAWIPEIAQTDCSPASYENSSIILDVPKNLHVTSDEEGKIRFEWDAVDKAEEYIIEIYNGDMTKLLKSTSLEKSSASITYGSRTSIAIRVCAKAVIDGEEYTSDWSESLSAKTNPVQASDVSKVQLAAPENVKTTKNEATYSSFSWDEVEGADQYQVVVFKDAEHTQTWVSSFRTKPSVGYSKLKPDTIYYYGVRGVKTVEEEEYYSDWTYFSQKTASDTTPDSSSEILDVPKNPQTVATGENKTTTTWDAVPGATGYQVRLYKDPEYQDVWTEYSKTGTELKLVNMKKDATYYYGIRAVKTVDGQDSYSDWVNFSYTFVWEKEES